MSTAHLELEQAEIVARKLAAAISARRIYAPGHSRAEGALRELLECLRAYLDGENREQFRLTTTDGFLAHEGVPVGGADQLVPLMDERECGGVVFRPGASDVEVRALVDWFAARRPAETLRLGSIELLDRGAGDHLRDGEETKRKLAESLTEFRVPREVQASTAQVFGRVMADARAGRALDLGEIAQVTRMVSEAACSEGVKLVAATQLPPEDPSSFDHSVNVFLLATTLLRPCVRNRRELERVSRAALLHDVGKSLLSLDLVEKKGELTKEEFSHMKRHPEFGARILAKVPHVDPLAIEIAYCHHMRDGGHGYPTPLMPIKPGPVTGIVQIGDMFETISEGRSRGQALSSAQAVNFILNTPGMESKRHAMRLLMRSLTNSPPGSEVLLSSGERGIVLDISAEAPDHPRLRVVRDAEGKLLAEPYEIDLREAAGDDPQPIQRVYLKPR
ncbi:MAG: HD-GYP domain-containing protein [Planctomycetota bacterium]